MSPQKTKLELTWIGKENRPACVRTRTGRPKLDRPAARQAGPRILLEDLPAPTLRQAGPEKSYHAPHRVTDHDLFGNRLIFGDNLLALNTDSISLTVSNFDLTSTLHGC